MCGAYDRIVPDSDVFRNNISISDVVAEPTGLTGVRRDGIFALHISGCLPVFLSVGENGLFPLSAKAAGASGMGFSVRPLSCG